MYNPCLEVRVLPSTPISVSNTCGIAALWSWSWGVTDLQSNSAPLLVGRDEAHPLRSYHWVSSALDVGFGRKPIPPWCAVTVVGGHQSWHERNMRA